MTSEQLAWLIRRHAIEMTHISGGSHIGAIMSVADIVAVLYSDVMTIRPKAPKWENRDRFILSKGHAGASIYAALSEKDFFPVHELKTHYANGSRLSGHVSHHLPGVDFSTGSLGHGLSVGCGMAYAARKDRNDSYRVFVVLGDGECNEGSVWEAALFANHFRLNNLVAIIDHNKMQSLDYNENTMEIEDLGEKWKAFGWKVTIIDGHDHKQLKKALINAKNNNDAESHKPEMIIANTIKGNGISFMENDILWHYRYPHDGWEYDTAVNELHQSMPNGIVDPYTPNGIINPSVPSEDADIGNDHTFTYTWKTTYPEQMRRIDAKTGTKEIAYKMREEQ